MINKKTILMAGMSMLPLVSQADGVQVIIHRPDGHVITAELPMNKGRVMTFDQYMQWKNDNAKTLEEIATKPDVTKVEGVKSVESAETTPIIVTPAQMLRQQKFQEKLGLAQIRHREQMEELMKACAEACVDQKYAEERRLKAIERHGNALGAAEILIEQQEARAQVAADVAKQIKSAREAEKAAEKAEKEANAAEDRVMAMADGKQSFWKKIWDAIAAPFKSNTEEENRGGANKKIGSDRGSGGAGGNGNGGKGNGGHSNGGHNGGQQSGHGHGTNGGHNGNGGNQSGHGHSDAEDVTPAQKATKVISYKGRRWDGNHVFVRENERAS